MSNDRQRTQSTPISRRRSARRALARAKRFAEASGPAAVRGLALGREWVVAGRRPRLHVLQIGKTATTAVTEALQPHRLHASYWVRLHGHEYPLTEVRPGDKFVFGVRDPIERFVSGFNSRKRQGQPRFDAPWTKFERKAFLQFPTPNELAEQIEVNQDAQEAMRRIYHVRSSYWDWFIDEDYFTSRLDDLLLVLRQDHLAEDFAELAQLLEVPAHLPGERVHANPKTMDNTLSEQARQNLRTWYRRDYEFLELLRSLGLPSCDDPSDFESRP